MEKNVVISAHMPEDLRHWFFGPGMPAILSRPGAGPQNASAPAANDANTHGIGDINSQTRGSGARFNAGKPPMELLPLCVMAESYDLSMVREEGSDVDRAIIALDCLGAWQARMEHHSGGSYLADAMAAMGLRDGWKECADVFAYGAKKYVAWNWSKGMAWSVPMACAARHLITIINGEAVDPLPDGSNLPHRGHVFCNLAMLATFEDTYLEGDDRAPLGMLANDGSVA